MTDMWETGTISIGDLITAVQCSEMGLPQFQRPWVWGKADWLPFLATTLRNQPTGTLLLLDVAHRELYFHARQIEGAPLLKGQGTLKSLLLDGQQRATTIYQALSCGFIGPNGNKRQVVLDVSAAIERGYLDDSDLTMEPANKVRPLAAMAKAGKIELGTLVDAGNYAAWSNSYAALQPDSPKASQEFVKKVDQAIPGFRSLATYKFPLLEVKATTPLAVVVDIFEGMNRRGQRLNQFDLMVARLYQPLPDGSHYDLRQRWVDVLDASTHLQRLGVREIDGMLPLQLIAMQLSRLPEGARPLNIKGLSARDVLEVPAGQVVRPSSEKPAIPGLSLESAVQALEDAAKFLGKHCGVTCAKLLPQRSMLLPIADQFLRPLATRLRDDQIKLWFFVSGLSIKYYGGVTSYAENDCKELTKWADEGPSATPSVVSGFDKTSAAALDLRQEMSREGSILGTSLFALIVASGGIDWRAGNLQLSDLDEDVQFHHVVPQQTLKKLKINKESLRPIAGLTPISASVNASIRDKDPEQVIRDLGGAADGALRSHYLDKQLLIMGTRNRKDWEDFLKNREAQLREFVARALGL